jgi:hypothetical protein
LVEIIKTKIAAMRCLVSKKIIRYRP